MLLQKGGGARGGSSQEVLVVVFVLAEALFVVAQIKQRYVLAFMGGLQFLAPPWPPAGDR